MDYHHLNNITQLEKKTTKISTLAWIIVQYCNFKKIMNMYLVVKLLIDNPCSQVVNLHLMLLLLDVPLLSNALPNLCFDHFLL